MANQNAQQDDNRFPGLIAHAGTAGTAETQKVVAGADGGIYIAGLHGVALVTAVTVGSASGGTALPPTTLANRKSMFMYNPGTVTVFYGGTGVGTTNTAGIPVGTSEFTHSIDMGTGVLYGRVSGVDGTLTVFEVS